MPVLTFLATQRERTGELMLMRLQQCFQHSLAGISLGLGLLRVLIYLLPLLFSCSHLWYSCAIFCLPPKGLFQLLPQPCQRALSCSQSSVLGPSLEPQSQSSVSENLIQASQFSAEQHPLPWPKFLCFSLFSITY